MADTKISALSAGGNVLSTDQFIVARSGSDYSVLGKAVSVVELIYKYTVTGSDKASIDTGADTADFGSNDWTNGDVLEIWIVARTDDAGATALLDLTVNNSTSGYDWELVAGSATTASANAAANGAAWLAQVHGTGGTTGYPSVNRLTIPNFAGTTFNKVAEMASAVNDNTTSNQRAVTWGLGWRTTSAINRFKVAAQSTAKLKVGSQLLIYKRRSL